MDAVSRMAIPTQWLGRAWVRARGGLQAHCGAGASVSEQRNEPQRAPNKHFLCFLFHNRLMLKSKVTLPFLAKVLSLAFNIMPFHRETKRCLWIALREPPVRRCVVVNVTVPSSHPGEEGTERIRRKAWSKPTSCEQRLNVFLYHMMCTKNILFSSNQFYL